VLKTDTTELRLEQKRHEQKARELERSKRELADAEEIIAEAGFGMWHIVFEDGKPARMRGNAKMMELLGVADQVLSEEELSGRIEGRNAVIEAYRSGRTIDKLFVLEDNHDGPVSTILREAKKAGTYVNFVSKERLNEMSLTGHHHGVIA
jgi:hypothetical protein